jgi:hypothetical protein
MFPDEYMNYLGTTNDTKAKSEVDEEPAPKEEFGLRVEIDDDVYKKVMHWIDKAPGEISGLGMVVHDEESNILRVTDAILLPQKNTSTTTELDGHAIGKAMFLMKDSPGKLKWWWHSHVDFGVFWSGQDLETIKMLGGGGWFLNTVLNKKREMKSAYCQAAPVRLIVDDLTTEVVEYVDEELEAQWDAEYEKNCKQPEPTPVEFKRNFFHYPKGLRDWRGREEAQTSLPLEPEACDNFPKEAMNKDDMLNYFSLEELYDMKEKGECSDQFFQDALEQADEEEVNTFLAAKGFDISSSKEDWE